MFSHTSYSNRAFDARATATQSGFSIFRGGIGFLSRRPGVISRRFPAARRASRAEARSPRSAVKTGICITLWHRPRSNGYDGPYVTCLTSVGRAFRFYLPLSAPMKRQAHRYSKGDPIFNLRLEKGAWRLATCVVFLLNCASVGADELRRDLFICCARVQFNFVRSGRAQTDAPDEKGASKMASRRSTSVQRSGIWPFHKSIKTKLPFFALSKSLKLRDPFGV